MAEPLVPALKEAAIAAGVAALLALPLIGAKAISQSGGFTVVPRIAELAAAVIVVFLGRFALAGIRAGQAGPMAIGGLVVAAIGWQVALPSAFLGVVCIAGGLVVALQGGIAHARGRRGGRILPANFDAQAYFGRLVGWIGPLLIAIAVLLPFMPFADRRLLDIAILVLTYVMLGWGLNIVVGLAGLLDLGYVAFYAVGAYSYALLAHHLGFEFWACLPLAGVFAGFFGVVLVSRCSGCAATIWR